MHRELELLRSHLALKRDESRAHHISSTATTTEDAFQVVPEEVTRHEHRNCYTGHGAPEIAGQGATMLEITNATAQQCLRRCMDTKGCAAVVLARDASWTRPYAIRQAHHIGGIARAECYLRGAPVQVDSCVVDKRFDTYVMGGLSCSCGFAKGNAHG